MKRINTFCTEDEREVEIEKFAFRHKWRIDLLKNKIEEESIKLGYKDAVDIDED
jgi:hypothetical protein